MLRPKTRQKAPKVLERGATTPLGAQRLKAFDVLDKTLALARAHYSRDAFVPRLEVTLLRDGNYRAELYRVAHGLVLAAQASTLEAAIVALGRGLLERLSMPKELAELGALREAL